MKYIIYSIITVIVIVITVVTYNFIDSSVNNTTETEIVDIPPDKDTEVYTETIVEVDEVKPTVIKESTIGVSIRTTKVTADLIHNSMLKTRDKNYNVNEPSLYDMDIAMVNSRRLSLPHESVFVFYKGDLKPNAAPHLITDSGAIEIHSDIKPLFDLLYPGKFETSNLNISSQSEKNEFESFRRKVIEFNTFKDGTYILKLTQKKSNRGVYTVSIDYITDISLQEIKAVRGKYTNSIISFDKTLMLQDLDVSSGKSICDRLTIYDNRSNVFYMRVGSSIIKKKAIIDLNALEPYAIIRRLLPNGKEEEYKVSVKDFETLNIAKTYEEAISIETTGYEKEIHNLRKKLLKTEARLNSYKEKERRGEYLKNASTARKNDAAAKSETFKIVSIIIGAIATAFTVIKGGLTLAAMLAV